MRRLIDLPCVCCQEKLHVVLQQTFYEVVLVRKTKPADVEACRQKGRETIMTGNQRCHQHERHVHRLVAVICILKVKVAALQCWVSLMVIKNEITVMPGAADNAGTLLLLLAVSGNQDDIKQQRLCRIFLQQAVIHTLHRLKIDTSQNLDLFNYSVIISFQRFFA